MSDYRDFEFEEEPGRRLDIFNVLTVLVLVLTGLMIACYAMVFAAPDILPDAFQVSVMGLDPTLAPLPTEIGSEVGEVAAGLQPTWTPSATREPTMTATPRGTSTPTLTPSLTPTWLPTRTPTPTPTRTNTPTLTPTPGPSPTPANTRSAFPFTIGPGSPSYIQNWANNAGCNWLGVAGQVFDVSGNPVADGAYMIFAHPPVDYQTFTGGARTYGPSGWEIYLNNQPQVATYHIQLFSPSGTPVSEVIEFQTWASCNQNLVIINFVQNH